MRKMKQNTDAKHILILKVIIIIIASKIVNLCTIYSKVKYKCKVTKSKLKRNKKASL
jgi:hypothetical protein